MHLLDNFVRIFFLSFFPNIPQEFLFFSFWWYYNCPLFHTSFIQHYVIHGFSSATKKEINLYSSVFFAAFINSIQEIHRKRVVYCIFIIILGGGVGGFFGCLFYVFTIFMVFFFHFGRVLVYSFSIFNVYFLCLLF